MHTSAPPHPSPSFIFHLRFIHTCHLVRDDEVRARKPHARQWIELALELSRCVDLKSALPILLIPRYNMHNPHIGSIHLPLYLHGFVLNDLLKQDLKLHRLF